MSNYGREQIPPTSTPEGGHHPAQRYQFNQEELRVLRECNRESFYNRCMPVGLSLAASVYWGIKAGYLKPNARFGAAPKMAGAAFMGYIIGKASYQKVCVEKLMQTDTPLGERLRKQQGKLGFQEAIGMEPAFQSIAGPEEPSALSDIGRQSSQTDVMETRPMSNFDVVEHTIYTGNDYSKPIDSTADMLNDDNLPPRAPPNYTTSYDDLRRKK